MTDTPKQISDDDFRDLQACNPHYVSPEEAAEEAGDWEGDGLTGSAPRADYPPVVTVKPIQWDKHPDDDEWYAVLSDSNYGPEMGYTITKTVKENYRLHMRSGDEKFGNYPTFDAPTRAATEHQYNYIQSQVDVQPTWRGMGVVEAAKVLLAAHKEASAKSLIYRTKRENAIAHMGRNRLMQIAFPPSEGA